MAEVKWTDNGQSLQLESDLPCPLDAVELVWFVAALTGLNNTMPLNKIDLDKADDVPCYEFSLKTADDRKWAQCMRWTAGVRWDGEFNVEDYYTLGELTALRVVRDNLAALIPKYVVTSLKVRW